VNIKGCPLEVTVQVPDGLKGWAVSGLWMRVAEREVEGVVMNKEVAEGLYEDYVARGKTVAKMSSEKDGGIHIMLG
jgi:hypothetical protein